MGGKKHRDTNEGRSSVENSQIATEKAKATNSVMSDDLRNHARPRELQESLVGTSSAEHAQANWISTSASDDCHTPQRRQADGELSEVSAIPYSHKRGRVSVQSSLADDSRQEPSTDSNINYNNQDNDNNADERHESPSDSIGIRLSARSTHVNSPAGTIISLSQSHNLVNSTQPPNSFPDDSHKGKISASAASPTLTSMPAPPKFSPSRSSLFRTPSRNHLKSPIQFSPSRHNLHSSTSSIESIPGENRPNQHGETYLTPDRSAANRPQTPSRANTKEKSSPIPTPLTPGLRNALLNFRRTRLASTPVREKIHQQLLEGNILWSESNEAPYDAAFSKLLAPHSQFSVAEDGGSHASSSSLPSLSPLPSIRLAVPPRLHESQDETYQQKGDPCLSSAMNTANNRVNGPRDVINDDATVSLPQKRILPPLPPTNIFTKRQLKERGESSIPPSLPHMHIPTVRRSTNLRGLVPPSAPKLPQKLVPPKPPSFLASHVESSRNQSSIIHVQDISNSDARSSEQAIVSDSKKLTESKSTERIDVDGTKEIKDINKHVESSIVTDGSALVHPFVTPQNPMDSESNNENAKSSEVSQTAKASSNNPGASPPAGHPPEPNSGAVVVKKMGSHVAAYVAESDDDAWSGDEQISALLATLDDPLSALDDSRNSAPVGDVEQWNTIPGTTVSYSSIDWRHAIALPKKVVDTSQFQTSLSAYWKRVLEERLQGTRYSSFLFPLASLALQSSEKIDDQGVHYTSRPVYEFPNDMYYYRSVRATSKFDWSLILSALSQQPAYFDNATLSQFRFTPTAAACRYRSFEALDSGLSELLGRIPWFASISSCFPKSLIDRLLLDSVSTNDDQLPLLTPDLVSRLVHYCQTIESTNARFCEWQQNVYQCLIPAFQIANTVYEYPEKKHLTPHEARIIGTVEKLHRYVLFVLLSHVEDVFQVEDQAIRKDLQRQEMKFSTYLQNKNSSDTQSVHSHSLNEVEKSSKLSSNQLVNRVLLRGRMRPVSPQKKQDIRIAENLSAPSLGSQERQSLAVNDNQESNTSISRLRIRNPHIPHLQDFALASPFSLETPRMEDTPVHTTKPFVGIQPSVKSASDSSELSSRSFSRVPPIDKMPEDSEHGNPLSDELIVTNQGGETALVQHTKETLQKVSEASTAANISKNDGLDPLIQPKSPNQESSATYFMMFLFSSRHILRSPNRIKRLPSINEHGISDLTGGPAWISPFPSPSPYSTDPLLLANSSFASGGITPAQGASSMPFHPCLFLSLKHPSKQSVGATLSSQKSFATTPSAKKANNAAIETKLAETSSSTVSTASDFLSSTKFNANEDKLVKKRGSNIPRRGKREGRSIPSMDKKRDAASKQSIPIHNEVSSQTNSASSFAQDMFKSSEQQRGPKSTGPLSEPNNASDILPKEYRKGLSRRSSTNFSGSRSQRRIYFLPTFFFEALEETLLSPSDGMQSDEPPKTTAAQKFTVLTEETADASAALSDHSAPQKAHYCLGLSRSGLHAIRKILTSLPRVKTMSSLHHLFTSSLFRERKADQLASAEAADSVLPNPKTLPPFASSMFPSMPPSLYADAERPKDELKQTSTLAGQVMHQQWSISRWKTALSSALQAWYPQLQSPLRCCACSANNTTLASDLTNHPTVKNEFSVEFGSHLQDETVHAWFTYVSSCCSPPPSRNVSNSSFEQPVILLSSSSRNLRIRLRMLGIDFTVPNNPGLVDSDKTFIQRLYKTERSTFSSSHAALRQAFRADNGMKEGRYSTGKSNVPSSVLTSDRDTSYDAFQEFSEDAEGREAGETSVIETLLEGSYEISKDGELITPQSIEFSGFLNPTLVSRLREHAKSLGSTIEIGINEKLLLSEDTARNAEIERFLDHWLSSWDSSLHDRNLAESLLERIPGTQLGENPLNSADLKEWLSAALNSMEPSSSLGMDEEGVQNSSILIVDPLSIRKFCISLSRSVDIGGHSESPLLGTLFAFIEKHVAMEGIRSYYLNSALPNVEYAKVVSRHELDTTPVTKSQLHNPYFWNAKSSLVSSARKENVPSRQATHDLCYNIEPQFTDVNTLTDTYIWDAYKALYKEYLLNGSAAPVSRCYSELITVDSGDDDCIFVSNRVSASRDPSIVSRNQLLCHLASTCTSPSIAGSPVLSFKHFSLNTAALSPNTNSSGNSMDFLGKTHGTSVHRSGLENIQGQFSNLTGVSNQHIGSSKSSPMTKLFHPLLMNPYPRISASATTGRQFVFSTISPGSLSSTTSQVESWLPMDTSSHISANHSVNECGNPPIKVTGSPIKDELAPASSDRHFSFLAQCMHYLSRFCSGCPGSDKIDGEIDVVINNHESTRGIIEPIHTLVWNHEFPPNTLPHLYKLLSQYTTVRQLEQEFVSRLAGYFTFLVAILQKMLGKASSNSIRSILDELMTQSFVPQKDITDGHKLVTTILRGQCIPVLQLRATYLPIQHSIPDLSLRPHRSEFIGPALDNDADSPILTLLNNLSHYVPPIVTSIREAVAYSVADGSSNTKGTVLANSLPRLITEGSYTILQILDYYRASVQGRMRQLHAPSVESLNQPLIQSFFQFPCHLGHGRDKNFLSNGFSVGWSPSCVYPILLQASTTIFILTKAILESGSNEVPCTTIVEDCLRPIFNSLRKSHFITPFDQPRCTNATNPNANTCLPNILQYLRDIREQMLQYSEPIGYSQRGRITKSDLKSLHFVEVVAIPPSITNFANSRTPDRRVTGALSQASESKHHNLSDPSTNHSTEPLPIVSFLIH